MMLSLIGLFGPNILAEEDFAALCSDREAIERVYHQHRIGTKPPFEQTLPATEIQRLVESDRQKEGVLKKVYGVEIGPGPIEAEVTRINATTRAPEILQELQVALSNSPDRFARAVAKPILIERELRTRFDNDDHLHASQRRAIEEVRDRLLEHARRGGRELLTLLKQGNADYVTETTWQLGLRILQKVTTSDPSSPGGRKPVGGNAQSAANTAGPGEHNYFFEDLPSDLQRVLRAQLRQAGDISAVIETPVAFVLYLAKAKTSTTLTVAALTTPKRSYEEWLQAPDK